MASWASPYIAQLAQGKTAVFRPRGQSMRGKIESGQRCTVEPLGTTPLAVGDIVLCTVKGAQYLHLVQALDRDRVLIGNNCGGTNGWTSKARIHGRCIRVED